MRLYLVRHAAVTIRPDRPSRDWHLSPQGRAAALTLAREAYWADVSVIYTSTEPKAIATGQRVAAANGLPLRIRRDLREVERLWSEGDYAELARRYLRGETLPGWEPPGLVRTRMRASVDGIVGRNPGDAAAVSHGLAIALYVSELLALDSDAAVDLWARLRFPDVALIDPERRLVEREFGRP